MEYNALGYNNFPDMNEIAFKVAMFLIKNNDNIFKLLKYYNQTDALDKDITIQDKLQMMPPDDISQGYNQETAIFFDEFIAEIETQANCQLRIVSPTNLYPKNRVVSEVYIGFQVLCHNDSTMLNGHKNRSTTIMQEVLSTLNGKYIEGLGEIRFLNRCKCDKTRFNSKFGGYVFTMLQFIGDYDD